ncbi:MAG: hypothetical protein ABIN89_03070, partial [Chitinophagaceae bacterium]
AGFFDFAPAQKVSKSLNAKWKIRLPELFHISGSRISLKATPIRQSIKWTSCLARLYNLFLNLKLKRMETKLSVLFYSKKAKTTKDGLVPIYLR